MYRLQKLGRLLQKDPTRAKHTSNERNIPQHTNVRMPRPGAIPVNWGGAERGESGEETMGGWGRGRGEEWVEG